MRILLASLLLVASAFGQASFSSTSPSSGTLVPNIATCKAEGLIVAASPSLIFRIYYKPDGGDEAEVLMSMHAVQFFPTGVTNVWIWKAVWVFTASQEGDLRIDAITSAPNVDATKSVRFDL